MCEGVCTAIDLSSEPETMRLLSAEKWIERTASLCAFCCSAASSRESHLALHDSSWGSHDPVEWRVGTFLGV